MEDTYPTTEELKLAAALEFIPASLRFLLQNLFVGKDTSRYVFHQSTPSWQGMMHLLHKECEYPGKSSVQYLPMIDMNPGDKTCILSTLDYLCGLSSRHNMPTIITFDQPLFWKASEIVNGVQMIVQLGM